MLPQVWRQERQWSKFSRSFSLPDNTDPDAISAHLDKGVLQITVPKKELPQTQPKRITVNGQ